MTGFLRYGIIVFVLLAVVEAVSGQNNVTFVAASDAKQIVESGYFNLTFTLKNAEGSNFQPPNFKNFTILNGPRRQISTSIYNGTKTSQMSLTYVIQPKSLGKFTIDPATIYANGKKMTSNSISVEVVKGQTQPTQKGGELSIDEQAFVRIEVDTNLSYIGQQIVLDYKLYTIINISNYNLLSESNYDGCFVQNIRTFNNRQQREIIDGVQYVTQILKRVALFPQQNGIINIEPASVQLGISTGRRSSSIFFNNAVKAHYTQTNGISINVMSLPDPPADFSGGVGQYRMTASISDNRVTTDDGIALKLSVLGNGDLKRVSPPVISSPLDANGSPAFEIYEPSLENEANYENGGRIEGRKDFEYLLLPKQEGVYMISPRFVFFDTDSSGYVQLARYNFTIAVSEGEGISSDKSLTEASIQKDHLKPYIANVPLRGKTSLFVTKPLFWIFYGFPIMGFLGWFGYNKYQASKGPIDLVALARIKAEKVARKNLAQAEVFMESNDAKAFYTEISNAYIGYVTNKLTIQTADLSKSNVAKHLTDLKVSQEKIEQFVSIISKTEMSLYSGKTSSEDMRQFHVEAVEVLIGVEQEIAQLSE